MQMQKLNQVIQMFAVDGSVLSAEEYGTGHINRTHLIEMDQCGQRKRYILQQINTEVFKDVDKLMENIIGVTGYLSKKLTEQGGDPDRETLRVIPTRNAGSYYRDGEKCYRMYPFIEDAVSYDAVKRPEDFYESAKAFGRFQSLLLAYPAHTLHETIPDFHNTKKRFAAFCAAVEADLCGRAASVQPEIAFVMEREPEMSVLTDLLKQKKLPLRVTHNDTKLNNVLLDRQTGAGLCVIDLDTVMPGLSVHDFGDAVRFGANTAAEDEQDIGKVSLDLSLYETYVSGYLDGCRGSLTKKELEMLPMGAKLMTMECGMRFLTDYLSGDTYFRIHRKQHNLDRCRTQFALTADMEHKWTQMQEIVQKQAKKDMR
ncbi:MAG: aminoglycoside phosphotransferase family protein [Eubacterium sp.]|nr:aminoglycoside phosphotransferase family protein [Eubacterium sp.]